MGSLTMRQTSATQVGLINHNLRDIENLTLKFERIDFLWWVAGFSIGHTSKQCQMKLGG
jgi:hypothetical protein